MYHRFKYGVMKRTSRTYITIVFVISLLTVGLVFKLDLLATGGNLYEQIQRLMEVVQAVNKFYVNEVDSKKLVDGAINGLLGELDPHSIYIPSEDLQEVQEQFEGEFEGIGIEFVVHEKVPLIISAIAGSPSERVGLRTGDRIVEIEGKSTYGITDDGVREKLLGPKGSKATIQIERPGLEEPFNVTLVRDRIPIQSVTSVFMLDQETGYIRVGRFARTTDDEFSQALMDLSEQGMQRLILDLRGNSGGYLEQAIEMADNFLEGGKRIVYTRGRIPGSNEDYYSTGSGQYTSLPLIVLINHGTASASEIVAGAMQDWDRGLVLGVTSFGKGLVQHQVSLKDGSAVRITIAKYYTPSGRLIQRSYENGVADYVAEGYDQFDPNALPDTTGHRPVFATSSGRVVYGGGGISPDVRLLPLDLTASTVRLLQRQIFFESASEFSKFVKSEQELSAYVADFQVSEAMIARVKQIAASKEIELDSVEIQHDSAFIKRRIKSEIARHLWDSGAYYQVEIMDDPQVREALKHFKEAAHMVRLTTR